jgi:hypothetical protein
MSVNEYNGFNEHNKLAPMRHFIEQPHKNIPQSIQLSKSKLLSEPVDRNLIDGTYRATPTQAGGWDRATSPPYTVECTSGSHTVRSNTNGLDATKHGARVRRAGSIEGHGCRNYRPKDPFFAAGACTFIHLTEFVLGWGLLPRRMDVSNYWVIGTCFHSFFRSFFLLK